MPGKGTLVLFLCLKKNGKRVPRESLHMCFVDLNNAYNRVPKYIKEWAMRKKPEVMVKTMGLYEAASTKIKVRFSYSEEFPARVGVQQGSVLSPVS